MSIYDLQRDLERFRDQRRWKAHHTPPELARAITIEAAELSELYLWGQDPDEAAVAEELADVFIYALNLLNVYGWDLEAIVRFKMGKNAGKYPVPRAVDDPAQMALDVGDA